jgi:hypothetical protein
LAQALDVASNRNKPGRNQLPEGAKAVIGDWVAAGSEPNLDVKTLHATIGDLMLEDVLSGAVGKADL